VFTTYYEIISVSMYVESSEKGRKVHAKSSQLGSLAGWRLAGMAAMHIKIDTECSHAAASSQP
jgi:hypothetical protein